MQYFTKCRTSQDTVLHKTQYSTKPSDPQVQYSTQSTTPQKQYPPQLHSTHRRRGGCGRGNPGGERRGAHGFHVGRFSQAASGATPRHRDRRGRRLRGVHVRVVEEVVCNKWIVGIRLEGRREGGCEGGRDGMN
jgi:hypothetical protein